MRELFIAQVIKVISLYGRSYGFFNIFMDCRIEENRILGGWHESASTLKSAYSA